MYIKKNDVKVECQRNMRLSALLVIARPSLMQRTNYTITQNMRYFGKDGLTLTFDLSN